MKTFAEMLNDPARPFTKDMRDAVEAYVAHEDRRLCDKYGYQLEGGLKLMRSTPPAKEPVSVETTVESVHMLGMVARIDFAGRGWQLLPGERIRVTKIEEPT